MRGSGYGAFVDILIGIAGAVVGGAIMRALGFGPGGTIYTILVSIGGAILLTWLYRLIIGPRGRTFDPPGGSARRRSPHNSDLQPGLIFVHPRTGFQVVSVHSIFVFDDMVLGFRNNGR